VGRELDDALKLLDSPSYGERVEAVRRLSALDDPRALEGLVRALHDTRNTAVVQAAAESLLQRFDSSAMSALTEAMESDDFDVTQTVGEVLDFAAARGRFADELVNRPSEWAHWWRLTGAGQLRTLLMGVWDPLGVADTPGAYDEYDSYAGQIFNKLLEGGRRGRNLHVHEECRLRSDGPVGELRRISRRCPRGSSGSTACGSI
jgi:HEAT repeats